MMETTQQINEQSPPDQGKNRRRIIPPALILFFLAPVVGELVSGSAPPAEFFNPIGLALLAVLYGGGALIVRELTYRWEKGWPTILILGAAYGIVEEALMVKSFFDPNWMDLGTLGSYSRWAGVNWVWSLELTIYHAVISIALPILLVNLLFPGDLTKPWLTPRGFKWLRTFFILDILLGYFALTPYRPPTLIYLLAIISVYLLYRLARGVRPAFSTIERPPAKPRWFVLAGFLWIAAFFIAVGALSNSTVPAIFTMGVLVMITAVYGRTLRRLRGSEANLSLIRQWAIAAGPLFFFILLAPLQEFDTTRLDDTSGMFLVGAGMFTFLLWLARRVKHQGSDHLENPHISEERTVNLAH